MERIDLTSASGKSSSIGSWMRFSESLDARILALNLLRFSVDGIRMVLNRITLLQGLLCSFDNAEGRS